MSEQNFSFLAGLEVAEKFGMVGVVWIQSETMSNLNQSWIELELGLGYDKLESEFGYDNF